MKRQSIEQLKKKPCRKGHSRMDAYAYENPFDGKIVLICKGCRSERELKKVS